MRIWLGCLAIAVAIGCGCEGSSSDSSGGSDGDAIDPGSIAWLGANYSSARSSASLNAASIDGSYVYTQYAPYRWPSQSDGGARVDAICCLFYERGGQVVGGKFDYWRAGGQAAKSLENVKHRYNGHSMPAPGTPTYTMIVSVDGQQRSNIVKCEW